MNWQPIEEMENDPIWVIKYTLYQRKDENDHYQWCSKEDDGAEALTDCHGWYDDEAEARKVLAHFPKPNTYKVEKVHKRRLKS